MKRILLSIMVLFLAGGAAHAKALELKKTAGEYGVEVRMDRNPPVTGDNRMEILLTDKSGAPVTDASVKVQYSMPAMPGMPPMKYGADSVLKDGRYGATLNFSMPGPWSIEAKINRGGKTASVKFNVDVR